MKWDIKFVGMIFKSEFKIMSFCLLLESLKFHHIKYYFNSCLCGCETLSSFHEIETLRKRFGS